MDKAWLVSRIEKRLDEGEGVGLAQPALWGWVLLSVVGDVEGWHPLTLTSGYRSPEAQEELRQRWEQGDRAGITGAPAFDSWHTQGLAFDVARNVDVDAYGALWQSLGYRWGGGFRSPSPLHFDTGGRYLA